MEFDKIRFDGANVELLYQEALEADGKRDCADHGKDPTPAFKAALQAFSGYVAWVHSWPEEIASRIDVRQVTIKRPDDAPRGITVTALLKCPKARNSTSTLNTPYLSEPPANYSGDRAGFLPESTVTLIDELENEAALFHSGERGEQTALAFGNSENSKAADERMAAAEVASTRKPKGKGKGRGAKPAADAHPVLSEALRQELLQVERDVAVEAIAAWTDDERREAHEWAMARLEEMLGQRASEMMPTEPACVIDAATLPLKADEWTAEQPVRVSDEASAEVAASAGRVD